MTTDTPDSDPDTVTAADAEVVVELQQELRPELKEPFGPIYTEASALLAAAGEPIVAVGDIVTYHLTTAGRTPDVALVDGRTKRAAVDDHIEEAIDGNAFDREVAVANPPATLSADLLAALGGALDLAGIETTVIVVDGEEDLAALPAIAAAPPAASVVYGQPDEGMVLVDCGGESRETVRDILERMDGDTARLWELLGVDR